MELSEGQRCLVALYMILHFLIAKGKTVFLDEPDNFISLREIQPWLLAAEDAVEESKGQLILISHHPEILNYWAREYGLLFSREENGHVRTKTYREVADTGLDPAETIARGWGTMSKPTAVIVLCEDNLQFLVHAFLLEEMRESIRASVQLSRHEEGDAALILS